jgi:hypothetical protein
VGGYILGGWLINPIISYMSGLPFTVSAGGNLAANGSGQTAALVGKFHILNGRPPRTGQTCAQGDLSCHYFDPSIFAAPLITSASTAHYGNTNRNEFPGPGYFNMNLSVLRDFKINEKVTIQVRADAFSLTNTPHFANPQLPARPVLPLSALLGEAAGCATRAPTTTSGSLPVAPNRAASSARISALERCGSGPA